MPRTIAEGLVSCGTDHGVRRTWFQVLNIQGNKIAEYRIENTVTTIPTGRLSKGVYILLFKRPGQKDSSKKFFVY